MIDSSPLVHGSKPFVSAPDTDFSGKISHFCIVGDGVESLAVANLFTDQSVAVCPVDNTQPDLIYGIHSFEIRQRGASVCFYRGSMEKDLLGFEIRQAVQNSRAIFVCAEATKYSEIANAISEHLVHGQVICLINAPMGGALEFQFHLHKNDALPQVSVIEVGRIFDSILVESGVMLISGLRKRIPVCGITRNDTRKGLSVIQNLVDETVPSSNIIERGLTDVERLLRPVLALSKVFGWSNSANNAVAMNEYLMKLISSIEWEIQTLSKTFGSTAPEFLKSINDFMCVGDIVSEAQFDSLKDALSRLDKVIVGSSEESVENVLSVLEEDVTEVYCLLSDLGVYSHLALPSIDSVIDLSCAFLGKDLRARGRSVESLGLVGFDNQEIVDLVNG